jgi:hypothetical protein
MLKKTILYPVIRSQMDTNIKIVEKIDPLTILGRAIEMQETKRFLPIMGDKDVDSYLETCRNQLRTQSERQKLCAKQFQIDCLSQLLSDCQVYRHRVKKSHLTFIITHLLPAVCAAWLPGALFARFCRRAYCRFLSFVIFCISGHGVRCILLCCRRSIACSKLWNHVRRIDLLF